MLLKYNDLMEEFQGMVSSSNVSISSNNKLVDNKLDEALTVGTKVN